MQTLKRFLKALHGLFKLMIAFLPLTIVILVLMTIIQLKADIQKDIEDIESLFRKDRAILENGITEVKSNLGKLKTVAEIKAIESQFSTIYEEISVEVEKSRLVIDEVLLEEWRQIKVDTAAIRQAIDNVKSETDKIMAIVSSIPVTIDLPFNISFEIPGIKELIQLVTNNVLSQVIISVGDSFASIDVFKKELLRMLEDGIQAVEIEQIRKLAEQISYLSDDIRDDIILIEHTLVAIKVMLTELREETLEAIHSPVSMRFIIYALLTFWLSLFYFIYIYIRYHFFGPFFEAIDLMKEAVQVGGSHSE